MVKLSQGKWLGNVVSANKTGLRHVRLSYILHVKSDVTLLDERCQTLYRAAYLFFGIVVVGRNAQKRG